MPVWKYGNNNLTKEDAARSLDCPISKTASEIRSMMEAEV